MWYDPLPEIDSSKVDGSNVSNSTIKCAFSNQFLPEYLVLRDGMKMKIRKKPKLLTYPSVRSAYEKMFQKLLLFYPFTREVEITLDDLLDNYLSKKVIIERIER